MSTRLSAIGLGLIGGYADATGLLTWNAFGANMTGNTVLLAIALSGHGEAATKPLVPIVAFFFGAMIAGALLIYAVPALLLVLEAALLAAAALSRGYVPGLGFLALAMGIQNTALSQFGGVRANTSFITGDYVQVAKALAEMLAGRAGAENRRTLSIVAPLLFSYALGAFAAAICRHYTGLSLLFIVPLVLALAIAAWRAPLA